MVNIMGIEHVGIGTDFDGDGGITGCASASELINFTRQLLLERYSEESIRLIWGGNFPAGNGRSTKKINVTCNRTKWKI